MCITWYNIYSSCEKYYTAVMPSCCDQMWIQNRIKEDRLNPFYSFDQFGYHFWLNVTCSELNNNTYHSMQLQYQLILHCNKYGSYRYMYCLWFLI